MKNRTIIATLLLITTLLMAAPAAMAQDPPTSAPDNDFIVRAPASEIADILARQGLTEIERLDYSKSVQDVVCVVRADPSVAPEQVIADLISQEPSMIAVEEVFLASLPETYEYVVLNQAVSEILGALGDPSTVLFDKDSTGTDRYVWTGYVEQDADDLVQASSARTLETGDGVVVAIIDTGIDPDHELFDGHLVPGYDFLLEQAGDASEWGVLDESSMAILGESSMAILGDEDVVVINESSMAILGGDQASELDPNDIPEAFGHGTMVAGIVHLVAPEAKIMPLRVFDSAGRASVFDIARAIYYAVDNGATVINMSFSLEVFSAELLSAAIYATSNGVSLVASVGNDGQSVFLYPAGLLGVFGVAATDDFDYLSSFSNYGWFLATIAAPGENVTTTYPGGGWASASGTSFAAPWISGAVALFADKQGTGAPGDVNVLEVFDALSDSDPLYGPNAGSILLGRVDIRSALDKLGGSTTVPGQTVTTLVDRDCWLLEGSPNENHGSDTELLVHQKDVGDRRRTLHRFDPSSIPVGSSIQSATLNVWVKQEGSNAVDIHRVTTAWTESSVTWNSTASDFDAAILVPAMTCLLKQFNSTVM